MLSSDFSGVRQGEPLPEVHQVIMPEDMQMFIEEYLESTGGLLEELEQFTLAYESGGNMEQDAAGVRRVLHKLKGEAGMVGLEMINTFCHEVEEAFERLDPLMRPDMLLRFKDWMVEALNLLQARYGAGRSAS